MHSFLLYAQFLSGLSLLSASRSRSKAHLYENVTFLLLLVGFDLTLFAKDCGQGRSRNMLKKVFMLYQMNDLLMGLSSTCRDLKIKVHWH